MVPPRQTFHPGYGKASKQVRDHRQKVSPTKPCAVSRQISLPTIPGHRPRHRAAHASTNSATPSTLPPRCPAQTRGPEPALGNEMTCNFMQCEYQSSCATVPTTARTGGSVHARQEAAMALSYRTKYPGDSLRSRWNPDAGPRQAHSEGLLVRDSART